MIEEIARSASPSDIDGLAELLVDAVDSGASVSFLQPFSIDQAREWWQKMCVVTIPDYALYPDGRPCDTVVFYKRL